MRIGTAYYESMASAKKHYFGDVGNALKEGAIKIGRPPLGKGYYEGYVICGVTDGRYFVKETTSIEAASQGPLFDELSLMVASGNRLELPTKQLTCYAQIKNILVKAGGTYRNGGFIFKVEAETVLDRLLSGEKIDDKKKFQFFATPSDLASDVVARADIKAGMSVLEPSAGQGALVSAVQSLEVPDVRLVLIEMMEQNCEVLEAQGLEPIAADFLKCDEEMVGSFDRIIANPPFSKGQDIAHIKHMHSLLAEGGRLVSMASQSWQHGNQKKQVEFREWLKTHDASVEEVPAGAFSESGTNVATCIITINKATLAARIPFPELVQSELAV